MELERESFDTTTLDGDISQWSLVHAVNFLNGFQCFCSLNDLPESDILRVHPCSGLEGDVELRAVGMPALVCHANDPTSIVLHGKVLVLE